MKPLSIYLDASTIGGYFDDAFRVATAQLWRQRRDGNYLFPASILVEAELRRAPPEVQKLFQETFDPADLLPFTSEADELAAHDMRQKVVPARYEDEARHVAIAVVHAIPYVVSWNFKHLVNIRREAGFNAVNTLHGYPTIRIVSPLEL